MILPSDQDDAVPPKERMFVRFGATFLANLLRGGLSFVSGVLIARGLGATAYGDLSFLLGTFAAISHLLEMGTSSAFFTFVSQRPRGRMFFVLYLSWLAIQFSLVVTCLVLVFPESLIKQIWVGQDREIIFLACVASFLTTQVWSMVSHLAEAVRKTVMIQGALIVVAVAHLLLVTVVGPGCALVLCGGVRIACLFSWSKTGFGEPDQTRQ